MWMVGTLSQPLYDNRLVPRSRWWHYSFSYPSFRWQTPDSPAPLGPFCRHTSAFLILMRLGIFGGSFDPVHRGHLLVAECCCRQAELDEIWFVPTAHQPLKPAGPVASDADRLGMLKLAAADYPNYQVSRIEIDRGGVSYSIDTLEAVHAELAAAELFLLMGADALADFAVWQRPADICRLATPLVVRRGETAEPNFEVLRQFVSAERFDQICQQQVEMPPEPVSSSQIRELIAADGDWQNLLPNRVAAYVREHRLYVN